MTKYSIYIGMQFSKVGKKVKEVVGVNHAYVQVTFEGGEKVYRSKRSLHSLNSFDDKEQKAIGS